MMSRHTDTADSVAECRDTKFLTAASAVKALNRYNISAANNKQYI